MKKGLIVVLMVVAIATLAAQSVCADGLWGWRNSNEAEIARHQHQAEHSLMNRPNWGHYLGHYPTVDLRGAHRDYWDEGLVDELGKVITLPFTLPMRVKAEWQRLDAKASHWGKIGETYEKGFPPPSAPAAQAPPVVREAPAPPSPPKTVMVTPPPQDTEVQKLEKELRRLQEEIEVQKKIKELQKEIAKSQKDLAKIKDP